MKREFRIAEIDHDLGLWPRHFAGPDARDRKGQDPVVNLAGFAVGARHGNRHSGRKLRGSLGDANYRRYTQLASDNRRMTGAAAARGYDRRGTLHDRLPIRTRRLSDQDLTSLETRKVIRATNDTHGAAGDLLADRASRDQRSEEHTSELQSHSFISYAVFCLKKKQP